AGPDRVACGVHHHDLVAGGDERVAVGQPIDQERAVVRAVEADDLAGAVALGDAALLLDEQHAAALDHLGVVGPVQVAELPLDLAPAVDLGDAAARLLRVPLLDDEHHARFARGQLDAPQDDRLLVLVPPLRPRLDGGGAAGGVGAAAGAGRLVAGDAAEDLFGLPDLIGRQVLEQGDQHRDGL